MALTRLEWCRVDLVQPDELREQPCHRGHVLVRRLSVDLGTRRRSPGQGRDDQPRRHRGQPPTIIYATIDPAKFDNPQRETARRRPELYESCRSSARRSTPPRACSPTMSPRMPCSTRSRPETLTPTSPPPTHWCWRSREARPPTPARAAAFSFTGTPESAEQAQEWAEAEAGLVDPGDDELRCPHGLPRGGQPRGARRRPALPQRAAARAERQDLGRYRQTHLDESMTQWATAGEDIPVFNTSIGRIGLLACADVRFPRRQVCSRSVAPTSSPSPPPGTAAMAVGCRSPRDCSNPYADNTMVFWYLDRQEHAGLHRGGQSCWRRLPGPAGSSPRCR